ncbi:MAG: hypothetical protein ACJ77K_17385 [Bacteroidia bacterium]
MDQQNRIDKKTARLVQAGHWLYDNQVPMTIQIFAINWDYWFDITDGYREEDDKETLNDRVSSMFFSITAQTFLRLQIFLPLAG